MKEEKLDMLSNIISDLTQVLCDIAEDLPTYNPGLDLMFERGKLEGYRQCIHSIIELYDEVRNEKK